jgi:proline racemase
MRLARMIQAVDAHAAGEPGRVIVGGVLDVPGRTTFEKSRHLAEHGDGLRKCMLREPRGYPGANCNLIVPSAHPEADAGAATRVPCSATSASISVRSLRNVRISSGIRTGSIS